MRKLTLFKSLMAGLFLFFCVTAVSAQQANRADVPGGFSIENTTINNDVATFRAHNPNAEASFARVMEDANSHLSIDLDALFTSYTYDASTKTVELVSRPGMNVSNQTVNQILDMLSASSRGVKASDQPTND